MIALVNPNTSRATWPLTPASSIASIAAAAQGFFPFIVQPFGTIQRPVSRDVIIRTSMEFLFQRSGIAATCCLSFAIRPIPSSVRRPFRAFSDTLRPRHHAICATLKQI